MVTAELFAFEVKRKRHAAIGTTPYVTAQCALKKIGEAAAVQENKRLVFCREILPQQIDESLGD